MYPQSFQQDPLRRDFDSDSFYYHVENTAATSFSLGQIRQPQPVRPIPGSMAWGSDRRALARQEDRTYLYEVSYGATYFPGPENTLGLFSTDPKYSVAADSPSFPPRLPPTPLAPLQIQDYDREGGWSIDVIGQTHYAPHGGIKEVDEDEEDVDILAEDSHTFHDEPLPPETTPPPRPKQMPIELIPLPRLPLGDESNTRIRIGPPPSPRFHKFSGSVELNDHSTIRTTSSSPTILTRSQELDFVEQILASIMTASLDINSLHARFSALPKPNPADRALCDKVGEGLHAVQESLSRHRVFPPEQWSLRSSSCRRKYECRLMSLQRTLRRLHILSAVSPRINQLTRFRKLLEQYDAKLSDLAVKFNSMFDRLYDRHWNITLTSVLVDIDRRVAARKLERKTARAARLYEPFYRNGRRPSMMEVS